MATQGNNINSEYATARDAFFTEGEKQRFDKLMQDSFEQEIHKVMLQESNDKLYEDAMTIIENAEAGLFDENKMAEAEYLIAHTLAGIEDAQQVREREREIEREDRSR